MISTLFMDVWVINRAAMGPFCWTINSTFTGEETDVPNYQSTRVFNVVDEIKRGPGLEFIRRIGII